LLFECALAHENSEYAEQNAKHNAQQAGVKLSRKITTDYDTSPLNVRIYQYQSCPFCSKVRAMLDYYGFNYEVVEVNPISKRALDFTIYKKVPIVVVQGKENRQLNDSNFIVSLLRSYIADTDHDFDELVSYYPHHRVENSKPPTTECVNKYFTMYGEQLGGSKAAIENKKNERDWRHWVDDKFIHAISPNVYRTWSEAKTTFHWFSKVGNWENMFSAYERTVAIHVGAIAMFLIAKRLKKRHNLHDDARIDLYAFANEWMKGKGTARPFMGGQEPNLADLALYGAITSFEGCPAYDDMRANTQIGEWYDAMKPLVNAHAGGRHLTAAVESRRLKDVV